MSLTVATPADLLELAGTDLGASEWVSVTQVAIDGFADATGDHQWIHVDVERAAGGPFGGTVAHGYLTLAMVIPMWSELLVVEQTSMAVNYGLDRVRFPAPVPAGSRLIARGEIIQVPLGVQRRHAAGARGSHGLPVDMVAHVACGEYARHAGGCGIAIGSAPDLDVAVLHFELPFENRSIGLVADGDEHSLQRDITRRVILDIPDAHTGHATVITEHFLQYVVPGNRYLALGFFPEQAILQDLFGTQRLAPVDQSDVGGDIGEIECFLDRRVAATDHGDWLVPVKKAVAGGTAGNSPALEGFLGRQPQIHRRGPGSDNQRIAGIDAGIAFQTKRRLLQVAGMDMIENDIRMKAFRVQTHAFHQRWPLQRFIATGPVFHFGCGHQLATLFQPGDQNRVEVGACRVDGRRIAGRARAQYQKAAVLYFTHVYLLPLGVIEADRPDLQSAGDVRAAL